MMVMICNANIQDMSVLKSFSFEIFNLHSYSNISMKELKGKKQSMAMTQPANSVTLSLSISFRWASLISIYIFQYFIKIIPFCLVDQVFCEYSDEEIIFHTQNVAKGIEMT